MLNYSLKCTSYASVEGINKQIIYTSGNFLFLLNEKTLISEISTKQARIISLLGVIIIKVLAYDFFFLESAFFGIWNFYQRISNCIEHKNKVVD